MFFYIYLQPEVISVAQAKELGLQVLISILRGFLQNCFLVEFEDYRVQRAIGEQVEKLDDDFDRKLIKEILRVMDKRNRFEYCLVPDHDERKKDFECAKEQAKAAELDLLLLVDTDEAFEDAESATLFDYQRTDFESHRIKLATEGLTLVASELNGKEFLDRYLKKGLRSANSIVICDKLFGEKYMGNYEYSAKVLFKWLEEVLTDPDSCALTFHCGEPDPDAGSRDLDTMRRELTALKTGRLVGFSLKLQLYKTDTRNFLPHQRFIVTDQLAIGIDPGMDFMDPKTERNRDVTLSVKSRPQLDKLLNSYEAGRLPELKL